MPQYLHIQCAIRTEQTHMSAFTLWVGQTRRKSLETDPGQSYFIHPGRDLRVLHRETWGAPA